MQKPIVVVGSINLDLVAGADHIPQVGETIIGTSFNTFHGGKGRTRQSQLQTWLSVFMVGNVGDDAFGRNCRRWEHRRGHHLCKHGSGSSGGVDYHQLQPGSNIVVTVPGANGLLTPELLEKGSWLSRPGFAGAIGNPLETVGYRPPSARHGVPRSPALHANRSSSQITWITQMKPGPRLALGFYHR
jgi:ribokinase